MNGTVGRYEEGQWNGLLRRIMKQTIDVAEGITITKQAEEKQEPYKSGMHYSEVGEE